MPSVTTPINDRQRQFVELVSAGLSLRRAARQVGYSEMGAGTLARQPHVRAAILARMQNRLQLVHAPIAFEVVASIMRDKDALHANRLKAAQILLDRAGFVPPKPIEPEAPNAKDHAEMTTREIEDFIAKAQREIASRQAKTIDITPQADDIFG